MKRWMCIGCLVMTTVAQVWPCMGQSTLQGRLVIDGLYHADLKLNAVDASFYEGELVYDDIDSIYQLAGVLKGDTLHLQELDGFLNPTAQLFLVRGPQKTFHGEWLDETHKVLLPARLCQEEQTCSAILHAVRYVFESSQDDYQVLHTVPLSEQVGLGQVTKLAEGMTLGMSSIAERDGIRYYTASGLLTPIVPDTAQLLAGEYVCVHKPTYTLEAWIPSFGAGWENFMNSQFEAWTTRLDDMEHPELASRFPPRYYLMLDINYWTEGMVAGSIECVGPSGAVDGQAFIYDLSEGAFVDVQDLFRGGNMDLPEHEDDHMDGWSMNYFGLLQKGPFDVVNTRKVRHLPWQELNKKLKKHIQVLHP